MLGVVRYPYMPTDVDRVLQQVASEIGRGETFNKAPVGVYFGSPGVEVEDPYFGGVGPRRTGCISCGNCNRSGHRRRDEAWPADARLGAGPGTRPGQSVTD